MTHTITNDLTIVRLSQSKFRVMVYKDPEQTEPYDLTLLDLLFISKVKITDADDDAVFELTLGNGLELDTGVSENNGLIVTIASSDTSSLPPTKATSLYCELIVTSDQRKTLGQVTIPVKPSVKSTTSLLS